MITKLLIILSFTLAVACSSKSKANEIRDRDYAEYLSHASQILQPYWKQELIKNLKTIAPDRLKRLKAGPSIRVRLLVIVDRTGKIEHVNITQQSGVEEADLAALDVFKQIESLPSPPESLIKSGQFYFYWDFMVEN